MYTMTTLNLQEKALVSGKKMDWNFSKDGDIGHVKIIKGYGTRIQTPGADLHIDVYGGKVEEDVNSATLMTIKSKWGIGMQVLKLSQIWFRQRQAIRTRRTWKEAHNWNQEASIS